MSEIPARFEYLPRLRAISRQYELSPACAGNTLTTQDNQLKDMHIHLAGKNASRVIDVSQTAGYESGQL